MGRTLRHVGGPVAGGVVGGLLGGMGGGFLGGQAGNTLGTLAGGAGGAYLGHLAAQEQDQHEEQKRQIQMAQMQGQQPPPQMGLGSEAKQASLATEMDAFLDERSREEEAMMALQQNEMEKQEKAMQGALTTQPGLPPGQDLPAMGEGVQEEAGTYSPSLEGYGG